LLAASRVPSIAAYERRCCQARSDRRGDMKPAEIGDADLLHPYWGPPGHGEGDVPTPFISGHPVGRSHQAITTAVSSGPTVSGW
jgi:hypothetical protein